MLTRDQNSRPMGYFVPWSGHMLFLHPKESKIAGIVKTCRWDGARGGITVPVRTKDTWFRSLGEVTVNWLDLGSPLRLALEAAWMKTDLWRLG